MTYDWCKLIMTYDYCMCLQYFDLIQNIWTSKKKKPLAVGGNVFSELL